MKSNTIQLTISSAGAMSGTSTITSNPVQLDQIFGYAIQAVWTGTPVGTLKLQVSCDSPNGTQVSNGGPDKVTNWSDLANSSVSINGSSGNFLWNVNLAYYRYVRISYTNISSTGTLTSEICVKGI